MSRHRQTRSLPRRPRKIHGLKNPLCSGAASVSLPHQAGPGSEGKVQRRRPAPASVSPSVNPVISVKVIATPSVWLGDGDGAGRGEREWGGGPAAQTARWGEGLLAAAVTVATGARQPGWGCSWPPLHPHPARLVCSPAGRAPTRASLSPFPATLGGGVAPQLPKSALPRPCPRGPLHRCPALSLPRINFCGGQLQPFDVRNDEAGEIGADTWRSAQGRHKVHDRAFLRVSSH